MSRERLNHRDPIVLKFGGSVLRDDRDITRAVHEIYRWVRRGTPVVAVVSALEGTTDALIARARTFSGPSVANAGPAATGALHAGSLATLLATGEQTSASLLGLALDRAGVPVEVLDAASISLRTGGTLTDAFPESLDAGRILRAFDVASVVVLPGFIGRDASGRTTLLGRGGSDLTALFVAERLIAAGADATRCRLVKDVDGLYESDPAEADEASRPRRFKQVHWDGALSLDGGIVQHKAVRYAKERRLAFEVGAALRDDATLVGDVDTRFDPREYESRPHRIRVALLGCGTVGLGVYEHLRAMSDRFEIVAVAVRDTGKAASAGVDPRVITSDPLGAAVCDCDLVIESIGGTDIARESIEHALRAGKHVVTANKAVVAAHAAEFESISGEKNALLAFSAAVGGGTPAVESVRIAAETAEGDEITEIRGVLNGTTNFVLGLVEEGEGFGEAVRRAQAAGFAEADPSRDLDGRDAADKLCVLAREAWGVAIDPGTVERGALSDESIARARAKLTPGQTIRHVARARLAPGASLLASVDLETVDRDAPLGRVEREWNSLVITQASGRESAVIGRGAGRWPTAESVIADVIEVSASVALRRAIEPANV